MSELRAAIQRIDDIDKSHSQVSVQPEGRPDAGVPPPGLPQLYERLDALRSETVKALQIVDRALAPQPADDLLRLERAFELWYDTEIRPLRGSFDYREIAQFAFRQGFVEGRA